jgi:hypothetical protein
MLSDNRKGAELGYKGDLTTIDAFERGVDK